jgi:hypothetical protein
LDASAIRIGITGKERLGEDVLPWVGSVNARLKGNPEGWEKWFAWHAGAGAGFSEPAVFATLDGGFTLGYENRILIPYAGLDGTVEMPLASRRIDLGESEEGSHRTEKAPPTAGIIPFVGLKLPFPFNADPASRRPSLIAEAHFAWFRGSYADFVFPGVRLALQLPVGP